MNKIFNTFVVIMLIGTIACSELTLNRLNSIKYNSNSMGKQIIDVVQIQVKSQGSIDAAVRMLDGLIAGLEKQQADSDQDHRIKNLNWAKLIKQYKANIVQAKAKIVILEKEITSLQSQIKSTQRKIAVDEKQIQLVSQKIEQLDQARKVDEAAQIKRTKRQEEMLKAVNYIIGQLDALLKTGSFVQLEDIKQSLQELVKENPIEALVQLTMTFNQQSVKFAIVKLSAIRDAVVGSLKDEVVQDFEAKAQYERLRHELNNFLAASTKQLEVNKAHLASLQKQLAIKQQDLKETQSVLRNNQKLLLQTQTARDIYNKQYALDKIDRTHEVDVIRQVKVILGKHSKATNSAEANHNTKK